MTATANEYSGYTEILTDNPPKKHKKESYVTIINPQIHSSQFDEESLGCLAWEWNSYYKDDSSFQSGRAKHDVD